MICVYFSKFALYSRMKKKKNRNRNVHKMESERWIRTSFFLKHRKILATKEALGRKEIFYLTTHQHILFSYMASDIWLRTILIVRKETCCYHTGYFLQLTARVLLYAPSHRQDSTYYSLCYTSRGALAGTRNSSMGPPHEGSIRRPIAP